VARLLLALGLAAAAVLVAAVLRRRSSPAPLQAGWQAPIQLDRADFARPDAPYLVALFSSETCQTCAAMARKVAVLACGDVAVDDVEHSARKELHEKYRIEAVPIVVVADATGVVRAHFIGPATATDLWAAVAEVRRPGSSPEPELGT
jgi:thioredoxin-related protein